MRIAPNSVRSELGVAFRRAWAATCLGAALVLTGGAVAFAEEDPTNPSTWAWPSVVSDESVRQSILQGGYTPEELRNIHTELSILSGVSTRRTGTGAGSAGAGAGAGARPASGGAGAGRWPPYFDPNIRFSGRAARNLEGAFGVNQIDQGLPDRRNRVVALIAKGDRVWITWMVEGTHAAPMFGFPPTGKPVQMREISMIRFKDGKIIELDMMADELGLYLQAGGRLDSGPQGEKK